MAHSRPSVEVTCSFLRDIVVLSAHILLGPEYYPIASLSSSLCPHFYWSLLVAPPAGRYRHPVPGCRYRSTGIRVGEGSRCVCSRSQVAGQGEPHVTFLFWAWHPLCPYLMAVSRSSPPMWSVRSLIDGYRLPSEVLRGQELFVYLKNIFP